MELGDLSARGLILLGCGKMGGALLEGWLDGTGIAHSDVGLYVAPAEGGAPLLAHILDLDNMS